MPTHGSITKAGKVRAQTPKVHRKPRKPGPIPRIKNRRKYLERYVNPPRTTRRRRRR